VHDLDFPSIFDVSVDGKFIDGRTTEIHVCTPYRSSSQRPTPRNRALPRLRKSACTSEISPLARLHVRAPVWVRLSFRQVASSFTMLRHAVRSLAFPARRAAALGNARGVHTVSLPPLDYDYGELEPVISGEIMRLHHQKHHQVQRLDPKRGYQTCIPHSRMQESGHTVQPTRK
jgi:hypothetical protein